MSCRLWVMLILFILQLKIKIMAFDYLPNCFYEKRLNTSLHGYNDLHQRWISEFDCLTRCLIHDPHRCRSFEHWHQNHYGLCVRANISLTDYPIAIGRNQFVDYYEIDCREDSQAIRPSTIHCSENQLHLIVKLDDIDPDDLSLGDVNCKPIWSNESHAEFLTDVDNCSLILINDSIVGKIRWQILSEETNSLKIYERFFTCRNKRQTSTISNSRNIFSIHPHHEEQQQRMTSSYRITLEWTLHNQSYFCPNACFISLYSFLNITLGDLPLISSKFLIDSCDLIALPPYTHYLQSRRLINQGCSVDPTVIQIPKNSSPFSIFHFSFYLYHILKEPIPFEIQCKIFQHDDQMKSPHEIDCSEKKYFPVNTNTKRDYSYTLFRSLSIHVTRQIPFNEYPLERFSNSNSIISIATVHYIECSIHAFFLLILYTI